MHHIFGPEMKFTDSGHRVTANVEHCLYKLKSRQLKFCLRPIKTLLYKDIFPGIFHIFCLELKNSKSEKSQTVVDINLICNLDLCKIKYM